MIKATIKLYEKLCSGEFNNNPYVYVIEEVTKEQIVDKIREILWQAIEIEGLDNSEVFVEVEFKENGKYLDRDESIMTAKIIRTNEPSSYIAWGDKTPHIFKIDRSKSEIFIDIP